MEERVRDLRSIQREIATPGSSPSGFREWAGAIPRRLAFAAQTVEPHEVVSGEENVAKRKHKPLNLRYITPAVARFLNFTAGYLYFTQWTRFLLFNRAWTGGVIAPLLRPGESKCCLYTPRREFRDTNSANYEHPAQCVDTYRIKSPAAVDGSRRGKLARDGAPFEDNCTTKARPAQGWAF